jgi:hypothetical protein
MGLFGRRNPKKGDWEEVEVDNPDEYINQIFNNPKSYNPTQKEIEDMDAQYPVDVPPPQRPKPS